MSNTYEIQMISDILQIPLEVQDRIITGKGEIPGIVIGSNTIKFDLEVISSYAPFSGAAVVVKVIGDLGLYVSAEGNSRDGFYSCMAVLDLTKLDMQGRNLITDPRPQIVDPLGVFVLVRHAIVAQFRRKPHQTWEPFKA